MSNSYEVSNQTPKEWVGVEVDKLSQRVNPLVLDGGSSGGGGGDAGGGRSRGNSVGDSGCSRGRGDC